jgi:hypothetical protein
MLRIFRQTRLGLVAFVAPFSLYIDTPIIMFSVVAGSIY